MSDTAQSSELPLANLLLEALPNIAGGSINLFDRDLRYLFAAGRGLDDVGLTSSMLVGRTLAEVFGEEAASAVRPHYARAFAGEPVSFEMTFEDRAYQISATLVPATPDVILAVAREISDRRREQKEFVERDRRKDEFIATLAHELRQPLSAMTVALEVMRQRISAETGERAREVLERQVRQLQRLLDDLLDAARISQGRAELRCETLDLRDVVEQVLAFLEYDLRAKALRLQRDLPSAPVTMHGDPVRLQQVFSNLLHNAVKFSEPNGQITVRMTCEGPLSITRVIDSGRGIPRELLPHIFDMFIQTSGSGGGLGIGLAVVKRLVERHGGTVIARSGGENTGAEFTVTLPTVGSSEPPRSA